MHRPRFTYVIKLQLLSVLLSLPLATQALANAMDDLAAHFESNPKPALSTIKLPTTPTPADKASSTLISSVSIVPITKGIFPEYRKRSLDENRLDVAAWSLVEYKKYEALGAQSEATTSITCRPNECISDSGKRFE